MYPVVDSPLQGGRDCEMMVFSIIREQDLQYIIEHFERMRMLDLASWEGEAALMVKVRKLILGHHFVPVVRL